MLRAPLLTLVLLAWPLATQAQTQASCTFNFFSLQTNITLPDGTPVFLQPLGIDDFGTVVGTYKHTTGGRNHGFIFHNGQWATLDYPHASDTLLFGITNAGQIIGYAGPLFLYENGTFKVISVPNSAYPELLSISPKQ